MRQAPFILVDNAFFSPASPFLQGADIIVHSLTKYINGHSDVVVGAAILPYFVYARQRLRQPRPKALLPPECTWRHTE
jgi:cystathionine gamma-lyase